MSYKDMESATYDNNKIDNTSKLHNKIKKLYDEMYLLYSEHIIKSQRGTCEKHKTSYPVMLIFPIDPIYCRLDGEISGGEKDFILLATYFSSCCKIRRERGTSCIFMVCKGCYEEMNELNNNMVSEVEKLLKVDPRADLTIYNPSHINNQRLPAMIPGMLTAHPIEQCIANMLGRTYSNIISAREDVNMKAMGRLAKELGMSGIKHGGVEGSEQSFSFINKLFKAILGN